jgi:hypothetical protein
MVPRSAWVVILLCLTLAGGSAWAEEKTPDRGNQHPSPSHIEGWQDGDQNEEDNGNWTWFGMGYDSRFPDKTSNAGIAGGSNTQRTGGKK